MGPVWDAEGYLAIAIAATLERRGQGPAAVPVRGRRGKGVDVQMDAFIGADEEDGEAGVDDGEGAAAGWGGHPGEVVGGGGVHAWFWVAVVFIWGEEIGGFL